MLTYTQSQKKCTMNSSASLVTQGQGQVSPAGSDLIHHKVHLSTLFHNRNTTFQGVFLLRLSVNSNEVIFQGQCTIAPVYNLPGNTEYLRVFLRVEKGLTDEQLDESVICGACRSFIYRWRHTKMSLMAWIVVIPKEGWVRVAAPILILVWHRLFK